MTDTNDAPGLLAYKGFDKDLKCRDHQFVIGESYEIDGDPVWCQSGFHACTDALKVHQFYPPRNGNRYCEVELFGVLPRTDETSKRCAKKIRVIREITLQDLILAESKRVVDLTKDAPDKATGDSGSASATGTRGSASATGDSGSASATGTRGSASATGTRGSASATGDSGSASATGTRGSASATGTRGSASATGTRGSASATGYSGSASATGDSGSASCGPKGFGCVLNVNGRIKGAEGSALCLGYRDTDGMARFVVAHVGEDGIKPGTWYELGADHKFQEVSR